MGSLPNTFILDVDLSAGGPGSGRHPTGNVDHQKVVSMIRDNNQKNIAYLKNELQKEGKTSWNRDTAKGASIRRQLNDAIRISKQSDKTLFKNILNGWKYQGNLQKLMNDVSKSFKGGGPGSGVYDHGGRHPRERVLNNKGRLVDPRTSEIAKANTPGTSAQAQSVSQRWEKMVANATGGKVMASGVATKDGAQFSHGAEQPYDVHMRTDGKTNQMWPEHQTSSRNRWIEAKSTGVDGGRKVGKIDVKAAAKSRKDAFLQKYGGRSWMVLGKFNTGGSKLLGVYVREGTGTMSHNTMVEVKGGLKNLSSYIR